MCMYVCMCVCVCVCMYVCVIYKMNLIMQHRIQGWILPHIYACVGLNAIDLYRFNHHIISCLGYLSTVLPFGSASLGIVSGKWSLCHFFVVLFDDKFV